MHRWRGTRIAQEWQDVLDVNLTGVFNTVEIAIPSMVERDAGGSIVLISSTAGLSGICGPGPGLMGYTAAKHGVVGLMRAYANNLAPSSHPGKQRAPHRVSIRQWYFTIKRRGCPSAEYLAVKSALGQSSPNALPVGMVEAIDISNAIVWLASDEARYVTGITLSVDAGFMNNKWVGKA